MEMIPLEVSSETFRRYVDNVIKAYQATTPEQRYQGKTWYRNAHSLAEFLDETNVRRGAGVIAALSANKRWADNVELAAKAFTIGPTGHVPDALDKVRRILAGEDPAEVLPKGKKTWWFYMAIMFPEHPSAVVVDRHAHDIAVGQRFGNDDRGLGVDRRYETIAQAYREAGRLLGIQPMVVQATTWVAQREGSK